MKVILAKYNIDNEIKDCCLIDKKDCCVKALGVSVKLHHEITVINDTSNRHNITLNILDGSVADSAVLFEYVVKYWDRANYVLAPAALYNGNRYKVKTMPYPPMLGKEDNLSADMDTIISDVPRLSLDGTSIADMRVGDLATPCIGYYNDNSHTAEYIYFRQDNNLGNYGVKVAEEGSELKITFSSPSMRRKQYIMCSADGNTCDRPTVLKAGDVVSFEYIHHTISCKDIFEFYAYFYANRECLVQSGAFVDRLPWSYGARLVEDKYNKNNWLGSHGFYTSSEASGSIYRQWQSGWVGGGMNTLYNIQVGNKLSMQRATASLDFIFDTIQDEGGFMYGVFCAGKAYGDDYHDIDNKYISMSRKNADMLYYLIKHLMYLGKTNGKIEERWVKGIKKLADAFSDMIDKYGHVGQFINIKDKTIYIGATASGGIVSAGLALCYEHFKNDRYLASAVRAAEYYYCEYLSRGLTNGGPGEIMQSPDSESAFGLLESYITLHEITGDSKWLDMAEKTAHQASSWCVSYDYNYPIETQFGHYDIKTTGAVWANVQNKHAAPGICTLSGSMLFRLYRATGKISYLNLLKGISHNLTQYISTRDRPLFYSYMCNIKGDIVKMKKSRIRTVEFLRRSNKGIFGKLLKPIYNAIINREGRITERVNLSDWDGFYTVGELPNGSCWCEVSMMLTYIEVPGIYVNKAEGMVYTFDHVKADIIKSDDKMSVKITNPTEYPAEYRMIVDPNTDKRIIDCCVQDYITVKVDAGQTKTIVI